MATGDGSLADLLLVITVAGVIMFAGLFVVNEVAVYGEESTNAGAEFEQTGVEISEAGEWQTINDDHGNNETVLTSRGYAIALTGAADSYFTSTSSIEFAKDSNWTVATWAEVDENSSGETMAAVSLDGRAIIAYNGTTDEWVGWYYDDGSRNSWTVTVPAANQPANLSHVTLKAYNETLVIYRNNTQGGTADLTSDNVSPQPNTTQNWDGRIEETRTFDDPLTSTQQQQLVDSPIAPVHGNNTARIMYDEPYRTNQRVLFSSAEISTSNASFVTGFEGEELEDGSGLSANHYDWRTDGPQIRLVQGTPYSDYPIVYVDYDRSGLTTDSLTDGFNTAVGLVGVAFILLISGFIIGVLKRNRR